MMRTPTIPTMPTFWKVAPVVMLLLIAAAPLGSAWQRGHIDGARDANVKAERLDRYCHLMQTAVQDARQLTTDRGGVAIWNDLTMYDARALAPCLRAGGASSISACADGDVTCVRTHAATALLWFTASDAP
jgi:hypothetical protein